LGDWPANTVSLLNAFHLGHPRAWYAQLQLAYAAAIQRAAIEDPVCFRSPIELPVTIGTCRTNETVLRMPLFRFAFTVQFAGTESLQAPTQVWLLNQNQFRLENKYAVHLPSSDE
jgi:hypothetical protein